MKTPLLVVAAGMLIAPAALAQSPSPVDENRDSMDRFFTLSESAATPPSYVRAETTGEASSGDSQGAFGVSQKVEVVVVRGLSLRVGAELRNTDGGFTPSAQAKYQFLRQSDHGVNMSAGLRYKQVGFQANGAEAEAFVAAGKRMGQVLATANLVMGRELVNEGMDFEGHLGVGYLLTDKLVVGANARFQHELDDAEAVGLAHTGREFELTSGAMVGYALGIVDLSLMGGWYMPRASTASGPLAMMRVGFNF
ncbi:MAG: hypothetical protein ACXU86_03060 [Archangium sp.]